MEGYFKNDSSGNPLSNNKDTMPWIWTDEELTGTSPPSPSAQEIIAKDFSEKFSKQVDENILASLRGALERNTAESDPTNAIDEAVQKALGPLMDHINELEIQIEELREKLNV